MILRTTIILLIALPAFAQELSLEQIMSDPEWIGRGPERPYWSDDSDQVLYWREAEGEDYGELYEVRRSGGDPRKVPDAELGKVSVPGGDWTRDGRYKVYEREGDLYVTRRGGAIRQLTRTTERGSNPAFLGSSDKVVFTRDGALLVRDLDSGLEYQPADLRTEDDPDDKEEDDDFLTEQQERLFVTIREAKRKEELNTERAAARRAADRTTVPPPWYLGKNTDIERQALSPGEAWLVVATTDTSKRKEGKAGAMPNYVTATGYTSTRNLRERVGTGKDPGEELWLLDLTTHEKHAIALDALPGIAEDPLAFLETEDEDEEKDEDEEPQPRPVQVGQVLWNDDGSAVLVHCFSLDRKDRWIAAIDLDTKTIRPLYRESTPAWINRRFARLEWLDDDTFYFLSEETGFSHLYRMDLDDERPTALTTGTFEVSGPQPTRDGDWIYYRANPSHPGIYEAYRVNTRNARVDTLTKFGGNLDFALSPDERYLLIEHSTTTMPTELYVQRATPGARAERLTHTVSGAFLSMDWTAPEIVAIPSSHGAEAIHSRVYTPEEASSTRRPAVVFIHGAGYLQNAHHGWSNYFREFMFHSLLVSKGYVVLDMDYRASAGYGRDWRTAIYRQMGTPELEDLEDGVAWLAANRNVDPERVGVYGGSYGGFLTLMALFTKPDLFACGAALRPVTDWASYNHYYTGNILNTPGIDPEAFNVSSPIEFAEGLTKPLLICHGMQDDNVFYQDSVRLAQRLIELKKEDWELASYPVEPHGFREPTSWLDEYRRILKLFETHLK